jgi:1-phosphofructokinase family hexose kinase
VLIATPNLCFDRTLHVPALRPGAVHRSGQAGVSAGGKGVNVARVLRTHGETPVIAGLVPTVDGDQLRTLLAEEGAELVGVPVTGTTRVATILIEEQGRVTVVNEPGPTLDADTWAAYRDVVAGLLRPGGVLVCTGSLPPGAPDDAYGRLTSIAAEHGAVTVVDAARGALAASLAAGPDLVCPNLAEAEAVLAGTSHGGPEHVDDAAEDVLDRAVEAARGLRAAGARRAVVTVGAAGAVLATEEDLVHVSAPPARLVSPVGAGDSFVGGAVLALSRGADWVEATRRGVATASSSVEQVLAGGVDPARVEVLLPGAVVRRLAGAGGGR